MLCTRPSRRKMMSDELAPSVRLWHRAAHAGFPSPGEDYPEPPLNLQDIVVTHPHSTYFIRIRGLSMRGANILPGDIVVVDRALTARQNQIVVARVGDHLVLKRLRVEGRRLFLLTDPPLKTPLLLDVALDMELWGVVTYCLHKCS